MPRSWPIALLFAAPAAAETLRCETPERVFTLTATVSGCRLNFDDGLVDRRDGRLECRVSTPQLRIATVEPDGAFTWEDTDSDRILRGRCAPAP